MARGGPQPGGHLADAARRTGAGAGTVARRLQAGFTLLEILVALVVLGFVLAAVGQGVQFGLRATGLQTRQIAAEDDVDAVDRLLRRLIEQADPGYGGDVPGFTGTSTSLSLTTTLNEGAAPVDAAFDVEGGRLLLRYGPHLHAVRLASPPAPAVEVLLDGVQRVEFAYWGATKPGGPGTWLAAWGQKDIPALVRIRLMMAPGRPSWPDIVAPTMRQRGAT